jgi:hypothetical protein
MKRLETDNLELRVLDDGIVQARRKDRKRLTAEDLLAAKLLTHGAAPTDPQRDSSSTDPIEGRVIAVKICSHVLDACIWLAFDDAFQPATDEHLAVFYTHELSLFKSKTINELREIHKMKLTFGPCSRVKQQQ